MLMTGWQIYRGADLESLRHLPRLSPSDRAVLERLLLMAPDMALATASAILGTQQGDLHDLFFPPARSRRQMRLGQMAAAIVYLALAMAAPAQGKLLPTLSAKDVEIARQIARELMRAQESVGAAPEEIGLAALIPDEELMRLLEAFIARAPGIVSGDPRRIRAMIAASAGAFYHVIGQVCAEQFRPSVAVETAAEHLARAGRTRELLVEALGSEVASRAFDPEEREKRIGRLREFGWQDFVTSLGQRLAEIAQEAAQAGLSSDTVFALTEEWAERGASEATTGGRYFIRPALLPDSAGLTLAAQEERLRALQRVLAGEPAVTGLRVELGTVEFFLEYVVRSGQREFLVGQWTRTRNRFGQLPTRFGLVTQDRFAVTLFPASRLDDAVGVCPVIAVADQQ